MSPFRKACLSTQGEAFGLCTGDFPLYGTVPRVFMPNGKRCKMSLGLELSLRASSFYIYDIIKIGRIAVAFLGNAADKRRMRTAWGSVHGILSPIFMAHNVGWFVFPWLFHFVRHNRL